MLSSIKAILIDQRFWLVVAGLLIASASFGVGYVVRGDQERAPIIIEKNLK